MVYDGFQSREWTENAFEKKIWGDCANGYVQIQYSNTTFFFSKELAEQTAWQAH